MPGTVCTAAGAVFWARAGRARTAGAASIARSSRREAERDIGRRIPRYGPMVTGAVSGVGRPGAVRFVNTKPRLGRRGWRGRDASM
ncbi:hypothetical protein SKB0092_18210 [Roseomonas mucosa]